MASDLSVILFRPSKYLLIWQLTGNIYNGNHSFPLFFTALQLLIKWAGVDANLFCIWKKKCLPKDRVLWGGTILYFQINKQTHFQNKSPWHSNNFRPPLLFPFNMKMSTLEEMSITNSCSCLFTFSREGGLSHSVSKYSLTTCDRPSPVIGVQLTFSIWAWSKFWAR